LYRRTQKCWVINLPCSSLLWIIEEKLIVILYDRVLISFEKQGQQCDDIDMLIIEDYGC
ncbi:24445_t:CDS:2, partial [Dentiscutata erythropus]